MNPDPSISPEQLEEIERYLQHIMTREEEHAFIARMNHDPQLKRWTEEFRLLFVGIQEGSLTRQLGKFHEGMPAVPVAMKRSNVVELRSLKQWMVAASVLLLVGLSAWLILSRSGKKPDLFAEYFQPDPGLLSAMGSSERYSFDRAMIDYKTGDYPAAIRAWDSLRTAGPASDTLNYFIGSAWLASQQPGKAIAYFRRVFDVPASSFTNDANWYLGLALMKTGQVKEAIPFIERSGHPQQKELLEKLKK